MAAGSGAPEDNGKLELHELRGIEIGAELVFLSGCETGLGIAGSTLFSPGEDYATLSQAFLNAGAQSVVATLWPVADRAAAELAGAFYSSLARLDAAEALANAQRALIAVEEYGAPYYWAAYQVAGMGGS